MLSLRSIPPITSTGNKRRKEPARLDGLAHMSLGRYIAERRGSSFGMGSMERDSEDSWDVSKHIYNKKPERKPARTICYEPKIKCITDVIEDFNSDRDLGVILQFRGFKFLSNTFAKGKKDYGSNSCVYFIPVSYKGKEAYLILSTTGDIFESEVVLQRKGVNQLFSDEIYIPELMETYNSLSMEVIKKNGLTIISYKRK